MNTPVTKGQDNAFFLPAMLIFVGAILFSTKAILIKLAYRYDDVDGISLLALRMLFSLPLFLLAAFWVNKKGAAPEAVITRKDWAYVVVLGLTGYYFASLMDFLGLQYVSASIERLILFTYPTMVLLFSIFIFKLQFQYYSFQ